MEPEESSDDKKEPSTSSTSNYILASDHKTPEKNSHKRSYTSVFQDKSSSESETSDIDLFSPTDKAEKCEGILENLIKSELCKMNRTYKINKFRGRKKSSQVKDDVFSSENLLKDETSTKSQEQDNLERSEDYIDNNEKLNLSAEENERYATIAKDLDILNTHGALDENNENNKSDMKKLYTGPYGRIMSPFKKFSSFQKFARGVKRSPRKFPGPVLKRQKLQLSSSSSDQSTPEKQCSFLYHIEKTPIDGESSDDSIDGLHIHEESEAEEKTEELEKALQTKSEKFSLSAINVKSILHKIITNENVVEMVRKAVYEEIEETEAKFEPKMTRSKVKEALETQGCVPQVWGISPTKQKKNRSSFLEIELPEEEEDDEDFNPEEAVADSDEDSESVMSSCLSDLDLTLPSTPTTPGYSTIQKPSTPSLTDTDSQTLLSPMGPPLQNKVPRSHQQSQSLGQKFQDAMEKDEERKRTEEEELIASRTRSKLPLHDLSVFDIEATFVAPDITEDLYDTLCDNTEWQDFLQDLVKPAPVSVTEDSVDLLEEEEDPEYNYLEEKEKLTDDLEDFRDDRAVKVSKKELNLLLDELHDAYGDNDPLDAECRKTIKAQTEQFLETDHKKKETQFQQSLVLQIGKHEKRQIDDQMRKHVQLLVQTFVMAQTGEEEHKTVADMAKMYLTEINKFAEMSETVYSTTTYRTCNLQPAVTIVNDPSWADDTGRLDGSEEEDESRNSYFKYENQVLPCLSQKQMETLWNSKCFIYPELLPHGAFFKSEQLKKDRARVKFLEAEDNLLAMGLEQFKDLADPKEYIHQFMLPCKSKKQIQIRIKNLSTKAAKDNPVKFYKLYKTLPPIPQCAPIFDISQMMAICDRDIDLDELPLWCRKFRGGVSSRYRSVKSKAHSLSFSVSTAGVAAIYFPSHSTPASTLPSSQQTNTCTVGSRVETNASHAGPISAPHKKKLDLDVAAIGSSSGSFIPLTQASQHNPITVCLLDKVTNSSVPLGNAYTTELEGKTVNTSEAPTIIFVSNALQSRTRLDASSTFLTSTSIACKTSTSVVTSKPDPIQSALISSNILSENSFSEMETDHEINVMYTGTDAEENMSFLSTSSTNNSTGSNCTASAVVLSSPSQSVVSLMSAGYTLTTGNHIAITSTHSSSCTDYTGDQLTQQKLTTSCLSSSTGNSPKSAIEIMASYAPYFVSRSERTILQRRLETTPVKRDGRYVKLAPKPTPASNKKPVEFKMEKKVSSPRRKQFQQRARAILPKGFVISKFDDSPTKRLASSLIDKAKFLHNKKSAFIGHVEGFRKILPCTFDRTFKEKQRTILPYMRDIDNLIHTGLEKKRCKIAVKTGDEEHDMTGTGTGESLETLEILDEDGDGDDDGGTDGEDGDKAGDTESEYTQSEDGNDTQDDSQEESQEDELYDEETHLANLMHASTTVRCDFSRDEVSKTRICKKDRDRDLSLAMLAPDIVESDQQRDYRDTAFAQAYLHKVKKALRDDMDTLEKFLQLMYNFSKTSKSPVKLYKDLDRLFVKYPELMGDFAGFLLPEQAIDCGCYRTHQEFNLARIFLRKLEICFSKAPHQFHKMMKTFSRWYRKPCRRVSDLREQIEPMLKGQRYLLEEFSKFFPDEQPPESMMTDFEEVTLLDSDGDDAYESVEEVDLYDEEETLGTKRCQCECHDTGEDHYRKKKKHCYRCCLTVIDGELVYKVNKTMIKKINVTFGPSVRVADFIDSNVKIENQSESELDYSREHASGESTSGEETSEFEEIAPSTDWLFNGEAAEKENIEYYQTVKLGADQRKQDKARSSPKNKSEVEVIKKPSFLQRIRKLSRPFTTGKSVRLSDMVSTATAHISQPSQTLVRTENMSQDKTELSVAEIKENIGGNRTKQRVVDTNATQMVLFGLTHFKSKQITQPALEKSSELNDITVNSQNDSAISSSLDISSGSNNDILAAAFNSALLTEVSMDSMSMPFSSQDKSKEMNAIISEQSINDNTSKNTSDKIINPKSVTASSVPAPEGEDRLAVSTNICFSKVEDEVAVKQTLSYSHSEPGHKVIGLNTTENEDLSKSPISSPFSPYSVEIQTITSHPSSYTNVSSPKVLGRTGQAIASSKIRKITPTQVSDSSQHSISSFQSVVENSPLICDPSIMYNPFEKFSQDSDSNSEKISYTPPVVTPKEVEGSGTSNLASVSLSITSNSQNSTNSSSYQKSDSTTKSDDLESLEGNISISVPVTFSEDANEDFSLMPLPPQGGTLSSNESLLHCLEDKSLHSISNLTNTLHDLEEKTVYNHAKEKTDEKKCKTAVVKHKKTKCEYSSSDVAEKVGLDENGANKVCYKNEFNEIHKMVSSDQSSSCDSASSDGYVEIGTLTAGIWDTDQATVTDNTSKQSIDLNVSCQEIDNIHKHPHLDQTYQPRNRDDDLHKRDISRVGYNNSNCAKNYHESVTEMNLIHIDKKNMTLESDSFADGYVENASKTQCCFRSNLDVLSTDDANIEVLLKGHTKQNIDIKKESLSNRVKNNLSKIKTKHKETHIKKKFKKQKQEKDNKDISDGIFDKMKMFACTSTAGRSSPQRLTRNTSLDDIEAAETNRRSFVPKEKENADSPVKVSDSEELPSVSGFLDADDLSSEVSSPTPSIEGHEWSKDTDKMILEACKTDGIKEKTFYKIAKQIGNVTPKQVRKRFGQLYKLLLKPRLPKT